MTIGTGIAIAGVWIFAGLGFVSSALSNTGTWIALIVAIIMTIVIL